MKKMAYSVTSVVLLVTLIFGCAGYRKTLARNSVAATIEGREVLAHVAAGNPSKTAAAIGKLANSPNPTVRRDAANLCDVLFNESVAHQYVEIARKLLGDDDSSVVSESVSLVRNNGILWKELRHELPNNMK